MRTVRILDDLSAAQHALDTASDRIVTLTEMALARSNDAGMTAILTEILEACAFDDLVGQRLARIATAAGNADVRETIAGPRDPRPDAALMNGPDDNGLKQVDIDILMRDTPRQA